MDRISRRSKVWPVVSGLVASGSPLCFLPIFWLYQEVTSRLNWRVCSQAWNSWQEKSEATKWCVWEEFKYLWVGFTSGWREEQESERCTHLYGEESWAWNQSCRFTAPSTFPPSPTVVDASSGTKQTFVVVCFFCTLEHYSDPQWDDTASRGPQLI